MFLAREDLKLERRRRSCVLCSSRCLQESLVWLLLTSTLTKTYCWERVKPRSSFQLTSEPLHLFSEDYAVYLMLWSIWRVSKAFRRGSQGRGLVQELGLGMVGLDGAWGLFQLKWFCDLQRWSRRWQRESRLFRQYLRWTSLAWAASASLQATSVCNKAQTFYLMCWVGETELVFERGLLILGWSSCSWQGCCTAQGLWTDLEEMKDLHSLTLSQSACLLVIALKYMLSNLTDAQKRKKSWLSLLKAVSPVSNKGYMGY